MSGRRRFRPAYVSGVAAREAGTSRIEPPDDVATGIKYEHLREVAIAEAGGALPFLHHVGDFPCDLCVWQATK